jgi:hypothetical protein
MSMNSANTRGSIRTSCNPKRSRRGNIRWCTKLRPVAAVVIVALALLSQSAGALGQNIVRIEEDWTLEVGQPDANSVGPQVLVTMSPQDSLEGTYFTLEINHRSTPSWSPGGISIHRWTGEACNASFDRADRAVMESNQEVVTWTQALYFDSGKLIYKVFNGTSSTWGPFGFSNLLKLDVTSGASNLNGYSPEVSVAHSGAAYAGNRIRTLKINRIRATLSDGSVLTDNTQRIVQQLVE